MRQFILPILALVSVVLYLSTLMGGPSREALFEGIKKDEVTEIEIKKAGIEYLIKRTDGGWALEKPLKWPADKNRVNRLIDTALKTQIETPITEDKKEFERYRVTDRGDYLLLKSPSRAVKVFVGKRGPRYSLVYVRKEGDDEVYLVDAAFADEMPTGKNSFRDRTLWKVPKEQITRLKWSLQGKGFSMDRTDSGWVNSKGKKLPDRDVDDYLTYISNLEASGFPKEDKLPEGAKHKGRFQLTTKQGQYEFTLYQDKKENYYILYRGHVYKIYDYQKDRIFREISPKEAP